LSAVSLGLEVQHLVHRAHGRCGRAHAIRGRARATVRAVPPERWAGRLVDEGRKRPGVPRDGSYMHAAFLLKSQHAPAKPLTPVLLAGAPGPPVPPLPTVPGVNIWSIGAVAGVVA